MAKKEKKTLGTAIDEIISALEGLEPDSYATAITAACTHLNISIGNAPPSNAPPSNAPPSSASQSNASGGPPPPPPPKAVDIKTLKEEKDPRSANEMACVVAHYLQELAPINERKETITIEDLRKYFKQAKFKLPTAIHQTLVNAKNAGYFDSAGGGSYKLNAVGYNLAVHTLPRKKPGS